MPPLMRRNGGGYVFDKRWRQPSSFPYQTTQMCFFGHTHVPVAFMRDTIVRGGTYSKFKVDPSKKYVSSMSAPSDSRATTIPNAPTSFLTWMPALLSFAVWSMILKVPSAKSWRPACPSALPNGSPTAVENPHPQAKFAGRRHPGPARSSFVETAIPPGGDFLVDRFGPRIPDRGRSR